MVLSWAQYYKHNVIAWYWQSTFTYLDNICVESAFYQLFWEITFISLILNIMRPFLVCHDTKYHFSPFCHLWTVWCSRYTQRLVVNLCIGAIGRRTEDIESFFSFASYAKIHSSTIGMRKITAKGPRFSEDYFLALKLNKWKQIRQRHIAYITVSEVGKEN